VVTGALATVEANHHTGTTETTSAALDVIHPSGERTRIAIDPIPFRIGRGPDNHLILRDNRASRSHASISKDGGTLTIEDLDSLHGTWVNGQRIEGATPLRSGDAVDFGFEDSYRLVFSDSDGRIRRILAQLSEPSAATGAASSFSRLRALVEIAHTLQSPLGSNEILAAIVEAALALTGAERGFLLLRSDGKLEMKVGRDAHGSALLESDLNVPAAVIDGALRGRHDLLSMSLGSEHLEPQDSSSDAQFGNVICVPLVRFRIIHTEETLSLSSQTDTVGLLYLDSRQKQTRLSDLNRELLHTLALEASTVLENATLLEQERRKWLLEQELRIAREIQRGLLPQHFPNSGWFRAAGSSLASAEVSGDYFDIRPAGEDMWAAVVADVSGKGVSAALLASLLHGAFLLASELETPIGSLMSKINRFLIDRAQGEKYATLFYATLQRSGALMWANAGHCAPLLVRANGELEELQTTGMPLGLLPEATFEVKRLQLADRDNIVAFSDGLTEAENSEKKTFQSELKSALQRSAGMSATEIHDRLIAEVMRFQEGKRLRDDVTVLVMEYRGSEA
jgi:serine phosphatase RsbU (regulator of sigma subunit)/pSer/pThr/pTyr-binding forkhead associated (FHA) protein